MGPKATSVFFDNIVNKTVAEHDHEHLELIILNKSKIQEKTNGMTPEVSELLSSIKQLEQQDVHAIALPCNTSHIYYQEMQKTTKIPIINMIMETATHIKNISGHRQSSVGILVTDATKASGVYQKALKEQGLNCIEPDPATQLRIMDIVYNQVKRTGAGNIQDFNLVLTEMFRLGCDYIIIGCTELSWFSYNTKLSSYCIDALEILTQVSIEHCGYKYRRFYST